MTTFTLLSADERAALFASARSLLGTPWRHQGRTTRGCDCIGFAGLAMAAVRPELAKPRTDYGRKPSKQRLRAELIELIGEPVARTPRVGDLVSLKWGKYGEERHVALVVDHPEGLGLIHADNTAPGGGRVIEHGMDKHWRNRIVDVWALCHPESV